MPSVLILVAALVAGGSLLLSGILKFGKPDLVLRAMRELRLPERLVHSWVGTVLPIAEVLLGALVILGSGPVRFVAAVAAAGLHLIYLGVVTRVVRSTWSATCHCFGDLDSGPVSRRTIARNAVLFASAVVVLLGGFHDTNVWARVALAAVVVIGAVFVRLRPRGRHHVGQAPTDGAEPEEEPTFFDVDGNPVPLEEFYDPPTVLVFFSSACRSCARTVPYFRFWPNQMPEGLDLQPVLLGRPEAYSSVPDFEALAPYAWYDHDRRLSRRLGVSATPAAVHVATAHPDGTGAVSGRAHIEALLMKLGAELDYGTG